MHGRKCPNVQNLLYESDRRIDVEWGAEPDAQKPTTYPVKLTVLCEDRAGMLKEFTAIISDDETVDVRHLTKLTQTLRRVPGVLDVQRVQKI